MRAESIKSFFAGLGKKNAAVDAAASVQPENEVTDMSLFESSQNIKSGMPEMPVYSASAAERRRAQAVYDGWVQRGKKHRFADFVTITPALAEVLLEHNPDNRRLSPVAASRYAVDMKNGAFECNGETVIIADTGELNDGMHRLTACVATGMSFDTALVVGVPRPTRGTVGLGKGRTVGDHLHMDGYKDANNLGTAGRILWSLLNFTPPRIVTGSDQRPTKQQITEVLKAHPDLSESIKYGWRAHKAQIGGVGLFAALRYWAGLDEDEATVAGFFDPMADAIGFKGKRDPAYICHKRLVEGTRLKEYERGLLVMKAWHAVIYDEPIRMLKIVPGESWPDWS